MKKLFILRSILKDWFTTQLPYTAAVVVTLVFSFLALFFVAEKVATENLSSLEWENVWYNEIIVNLGMDGEELPAFDPSFMLDDAFYEKYLQIDLPPLTDFQTIWGYCKYTEKNSEKLAGTDFCQLKAFPLFAPSEQAYYEPIKNALKYQYDIIQGRDITAEELESKNRVVVAPEGYALAVGDKITMSGMEFEVVGLNKPSPYNISDDEMMAVPYWYFNDAMQHPYDLTDNTNCHYNPAYDDKPKNNVYVPTELPKDTVYISYGEMFNGQEYNYDAYLVMDSDRFMFDGKITQSQRQKLAALIGVDISRLTTSYEQDYKYNVQEYQHKALKESVLVAAFCVMNILMLIVFLCGKNVRAFRMFRVYGASRIHIFLLNFAAALVCILIALGIGTALSPQVLRIVAAVNSNYEFRPYCVKLAAAVFTASAVLAAIPAAVSAVVKSPVRK
ncbi:MAG: ABC transporter permease [Oscillospiraceae bacterium]